MTFLVTAALAVALLVSVPVAAHLLRRGRAHEREFPPTSLVPPAPPVARRRSRLEDRALLGIRSLLVVALAALGAGPLVRCSRLSLARDAGASVALAIVLDDSASMRLTTPSGAARWERAVSGARELLRSAREGDAVAIVLAGRPSRLALAATTDLSAARAALDALSASDRATDLANAVKLARAALAELPHADRRVLVLSDLAGDELPQGSPPVWVPLPELTRPAADCGVVRAERGGARVTAEIACNEAAAASGRRLEVIVADAPARAAAPATSAGPTRPPEGAVVGSAPIAERSGTQTVAVELPPLLGELDARLTGRDAAHHDDRAPIVAERGATTVAVLADPNTGSAATGGPPVVEQALRALESGATVKPLTLLPDDTSSLAGWSALVLDDPAGIGPEAREALVRWLERGGVALALLGPSAGRAELGASLEPFVTGSPRWSETTSPGIDPTTATALGPEAPGLAALAPRGRVPLSGALPGGARVLARWTDGDPFLFERDVGRGLVLTASLPASPQKSDFALRPAFLALLAQTIDEAARRHGPRVTTAGSPWVFQGEDGVRITPPTGDPVTVAPERDPAHGAPRGVFTPAVRGRYRVVRGQEAETRVVTLTADELTQRPRAPERPGTPVHAGDPGRVDASREAALAVLLLFAAEAVGRLGVRGRLRRRPAAAP